MNNEISCVHFILRNDLFFLQSLGCSLWSSSLESMIEMIHLLIQRPDTLPGIERGFSFAVSWLFITAIIFRIYN